MVSKMLSANATSRVGFHAICKPKELGRQVSQVSEMSDLAILSGFARQPVRERPLLPRKNGYKCPHAFSATRAVGDEVRCSVVPCDSRSCPVCGELWIARQRCNVTWCLGEYRQGNIFLYTIYDKDWARFQRGLKRAGGLYWAIVVDGREDRKLVFATASLPKFDPITYVSSVAQLVAADQVPMAAMVKKPILASPVWRLSHYERVEAERLGKKPAVSRLLGVNVNLNVMELALIAADIEYHVTRHIDDSVRTLRFVLPEGMDADQLVKLLRCGSLYIESAKRAGMLKSILAGCMSINQYCGSRKKAA